MTIRRLHLAARSHGDPVGGKLVVAQDGLLAEQFLVRKFRPQGGDPCFDIASLAFHFTRPPFYVLLALDFRRPVLGLLFETGRSSQDACGPDVSLAQFYALA